MARDSSAEVRRRVLRRYNRDPTGWRVWAGVDDERNLTTVYIHRGSMWVVKDFPVNPAKMLGVGGKTKTDEALAASTEYSFGFRPLSEDHIAKLMAGDSNVLVDVLSANPQAEEDIEDQPVIHGPFHSPNAPIAFRGHQAKLDAKLRADLAKLIGKEYPEFYNAYR